MGESNTFGLDIIEKSIITDYFTPNIKSEVIFDMLLAPVITEIIQVILNEDTELIAKEFPLLNRNFSQCSESGYRNCNIDYLLRSTDKKIWYLVELKTTESSEDKQQRDNYKDLLGKKINIYNDFVELLLHIYGKKHGSSEDSLKSVFGNIIGENCDIGNSTYSELAVQKLKSLKVTGSKKYLYTAARLLDKGIGTSSEEIGYESLKIIYITPNGKNNDEQIDYISIKEIIENEKEISKKFKEKGDKKVYWQWLVNLLKTCF